MRRSILVALLAAACLAAIWSFSSWAQVIDSTTCERSCYAQKSACVTACGEHDNPVECEEQCDDQYQDCMEQCG